ncbi:tRNA (uracil-5-)-methyltransferase homolog A-like [Dermacentor albipictus]|uniref:tRNA (uracil-5-)-methyltransferase homolog A-like n=1 Tax=Dermacentor albipictus TaxID=60249 RepID=UPI0038FC1059
MSTSDDIVVNAVIESAKCTGDDGKACSEVVEKSPSASETSAEVKGGITTSSGNTNSENATSDETNKVHDPYFYTKRDEFTSEVHKIEIGNLPKIFGHGQMKKLLSKTLHLNPHKIKVVNNARFAFVSFRSEEDRESALQKIQGYKFKGCTLTVKKANPMADPLIQKRKLGEAEEVIPLKRQCDESSISERIRESVASWSDLPYQQQLEQKEEQMRKVMVKYARKLEQVNPRLKSWINKQREVHKLGVCPLEPIRASPVVDGYRNKNEFTVGRHLETGEVVVGFRISSYRQGSMSVASAADLPNIPEPAKKVAQCFQDYVRQSGKEPFNPETHEGYWRQLTVRTTRRGHIMAIAVIHPQALSEEDILQEKEKLRQFFTEGPGKPSGVTSFHFQRFDKKRSDEDQPEYEHVFGTEDIEETLLGLTFQVSPDAFFQVNTPAAEVLYRAAEEVAGLSAETTLLDICCGTGTIGLSLASKVKKVYGVEVCRRAVQNAKRNAELNGIKNASFVQGKAEDVIQDVIRSVGGSEEIVAIVDPPRQGLHNKVLRTLRWTASIKKLVYVSCNPEGALQNFLDLARAASNNYRGDPFVLTKAVPVDMFPHTPHTELVLLMERLSV